MCGSIEKQQKQRISQRALILVFAELGSVELNIYIRSDADDDAALCLLPEARHTLLSLIIHASSIKSRLKQQGFSIRDKANPTPLASSCDALGTSCCCYLKKQQGCEVSLYLQQLGEEEPQLIYINTDPPAAG